MIFFSFSKQQKYIYFIKLYTKYHNYIFNMFFLHFFFLFFVILCNLYNVNWNVLTSIYNNSSPACCASVRKMQIYFRLFFVGSSKDAQVAVATSVRALESFVCETFDHRTRERPWRDRVLSPSHAIFCSLSLKYAH